MRSGKKPGKKTGKIAISIVIPVFREEKRIERCIHETVFFFSRHPRISSFEVIFVADRSGDKTIGIIAKACGKDNRLKLIVNSKRLQKGFSVRKGMLSARHNTVLFYDADLSVPLTELDRFLPKLRRHDILIASRGMADSKVEKKLFKSILSWGFSIWKRLVLGLQYRDSQCGFKVFNSKSIAVFRRQTLASSCFDVEILYIADSLGLRTAEVPVTWIDSDSSNFSTIRVIFRCLVDVVKIRINDMAGKYN